MSGQLLNVQLTTVRACEVSPACPRGKEVTSLAVVIDMEARTVKADHGVLTPAELRDIALAVTKLADEFDAAPVPGGEVGDG